MENFNKGQLDEILNRLVEIERQLNTNDSKLADFISEHQAKKMFKRGTTWFWNLRQEGFPFTKLGGEVYYLKSDIAEYLLSNKRGG
jgi:hypothetical protein